MPGRSILILSLYTPPATASAARRPAGLAKYLARQGHRVTVLTSSFSGEGEIEGAQRVIRTRDLLTSGLNWRRANVEAVRGSEGAPAEVAPPSRIEPWIVPDVQAFSWLPFALPAARRAAREEGIDAVISSGPPHSTHLVAAALARQGIPVLMELRDGWGYERAGEFARPALAALDRRLERRAFRRADYGVGVSEPLTRDLRERLGVHAVTLPLAYDPDEMDAAEHEIDSVRRELLDPRRHSIVYTGSLVGSGVSATTAVEGFAGLREAEPELWDKTELVVVGPVATSVRERIGALGIEPVLRLLPSIGRTRALALQRAADSLLNVCNETRPSVLTNKQIEYFVAARPMLVIGADSEAARLVHERRAGLVASSFDVAETTRAFAALARGQAPSASADGMEEYSYPVVAARFAELVEDAIAARRPASAS